MTRAVCGTCVFWGRKPNVVVSATVKEGVQVCCHEIITQGTIITHELDTCTKWAESINQ